jgi:putative ABC transport system permease protein
MAAVTRLRAYAGLWLPVGLLGLALVFVAAAAGPVNRHVLEQAFQQTVAEAPAPARDITFTERTAPADPEAGGSPAGSAEQIRGDAQALLPPALAEVVEVNWGMQRSRTERPSTSTPGRSASLVGPGVVTDPLALHPLVTLHHQTGLAPEIQLVDGVPPATGPVIDPAEAAIEVMAAAEVADTFGLRVGQTYHLLFGVAPLPPGQSRPGTPQLAITLTGVFQPADPAAAIWQSDPRLLRPVPRAWPHFDLLVPLPMATLVTDQPGIDALFALGLNPLVEIENVARVRIDQQRLDQAWAVAGRDAVAELLASPDLRPGLTIQTGLAELIDEFERQAVAARAVTAVVAAGLVGTGIGLLLLAARVTVDRRGGELSLLRARGASLLTVVRRSLAEALLVLLPAAAVGWLLHRLLPGRPDPGVVLGLGMVPLLVAAVVVLAVPATFAGAVRARARGDRAGPARSDRAGAARGDRAGAGRRELARYRSAPVRVTLELLVVLLAGLGVVQLQQRGLTGTSVAARVAGGLGGTDPYLSAVPVLIGLAAGLLALRLYPWPLRLLGALAARRRGVVGFLGLARAGRAAPATVLPMLVLVLAVTVGGFAGAVNQAVLGARDAATIRAVGADLRVGAEGELTDAALAEVAAVPGVTSVAGVVEDGFIRIDGQAVQAAAVMLVDAPGYQRVLAAIGAPGRLPEPVVSAVPGTGPVPVLAPRLDPARSLVVEIDQVEYPAEVVGGVDDLPALHGARIWVLVPRQALAEPPPVDQLLIAGPQADLAAVRAAVARGTGGDPDAVTVASLAGERARLEASGFNQTLTLVFVTGTVGAGVGGLLAVGLALVVQAAARGRAVSLLRTMGLSTGQARGLLLVELVPVTALAVAVGAVAGTFMPVVLAPALGLTEFTGGAPLPVSLDPGTVIVLAVLLGLFVIGGALVEAAVNRRLGLGQVLRVD